MIIYKNIFELLSKAGHNSTRIWKERTISQHSMHAIRHNMPLSTKTIDTICRLAGCQPGDIMAYVPDPTSEE